MRGRRTRLGTLQILVVVTMQWQIAAAGRGVAGALLPPQPDLFMGQSLLLHHNDLIGGAPWSTWAY